MKIRSAIPCLLTSLALALAPLQQVRAEVSEVRLAQQFSMGYMQFAIMERNFMHKVGSIKKKPATWKDLFFPEIHGVQGG